MSLSTDPIGRTISHDELATRLNECIACVGITNEEIKTIARQHASRLTFQRVSEASRSYAFRLTESVEGEIKWKPIAPSSSQHDIESPAATNLDFATIDNFHLSGSQLLPIIEQLSLERGCSFELSMCAPYLLNSELDPKWARSVLFDAICKDERLRISELCKEQEATSRNTISGPVYRLTGDVYLATLPILEFCVTLGSDVGLDSCLSSLLSVSPDDAAEALCSAIIIANREAVERLIEVPGVLNFQYSPDGSRPLHIAVQNENAHAVKVLLSAGCDGNVSNGDGKTPLQLALENESEELVRLLR